MARMVNKSIQCGQEFLVTTGYDVLGKSTHLIQIGGALRKHPSPYGY